MDTTDDIEDTSESNDDKVAEHDEQGLSRITNLRVNVITRTASNNQLYYHAHHTITSINRNYDIDYGENESLSFTEKLFKFFKPFPFRSTHPLPVLDPDTTSEQIIRGNNPANELARQKKFFYNDVGRYVHYAKRQKSHAAEVRSVIKNIKSGEISGYSRQLILSDVICKLAKILESDPDPMFKSNYNWYYTGGCVATATVNGRTILFTARGPKCDSLYCVPLKRSSSMSSGYRAKETYSKYVRCKTGHSIYQITAAEHGDQAMIGVRKRDSCKVYYCHRNPSTSLKLLHKSHSVIAPFTSMAMSPWRAENMCTLDMQCSLLLWDLTAKKHRRIEGRWEQAKMPNDSQWCGVHYDYKSPDLLHLSHNTAAIFIDTKDRTVNYSKLVSLDQLDQLVHMQCEVITAAASSVVSNYIQYIATTHHLISLDVRKPGQALQCWTHMMRGPPQHIGLCCDKQGREVICLGNTETSDVITLVNEWPNYDVDRYPVSRTQPYAIRSIYETLMDAKMEGLCLSPTIQSRLKLSLTGLTCVSGSSPVIFTSTSAGDVFCQRLSLCSDEFDEEEEKLSFTARMTFWQEKLKDIEQVPLGPVYFTNYIDGNAFRDFEMPSDDEDVTCIKEVQSKVSEVPPWIPSKEMLFSSKDQEQAADILKDWGITDHNSWEKLQMEAFGLSSDAGSSNFRVQQWLTSNSASQNDSDSQLVQETQVSSVSQMSATEHISASQQQVDQMQPPVQFLSQQTTDADSDLLLLTQKSLMHKSNTTKKRKRRNDGF